MDNFFKLALLGLMIIFLIIALHYINWLKPVENALIKVLGPGQEKIYSLVLDIKDFRTRWLIKRDWLQENEELRKKFEELRIDQSSLNSLKSENDLLKQELNFTQEREIKTVTAKIITGVSDSLSKSVIINKGFNDQVEDGLAVVAGPGVMVGKIYDVYADHSKVLLLTDNQSRVAATIQNLNKTTGLVEGQFGLSFAMTNIPQDQEVKNGDLIVTSGLEGKIPKDLLIAQVESVNEVESEIFKTTLLTPIIPFDNLSYVLVILR